MFYTSDTPEAAVVKARCRVWRSADREYNGIQQVIKHENNALYHSISKLVLMISENMLLYISGEYGKPNVINPKI